MSVLLLRSDTTRTISTPSGDIEVPDINLPQSVQWGASVIEGVGTYFNLKRDGKRTNLLMDGPFAVGPAKLFVVTVSTQEDPSTLLQFFKSRLGNSNAEWLKRALVQDANVRSALRPIFREYREDGILRGVFARHSIGNSATLSTDPDEVGSVDIPED